MNILNKKKIVIALITTTLLLVLVLIVYINKPENVVESGAANGRHVTEKKDVHTASSDDPNIKDEGNIGSATSKEELVGEIISTEITQIELEREQNKPYTPDNISTHAVIPPDKKRLEKSLRAANISDMGISLSAVPLAPRSPAGKKPFTRMEGHEIGIPHLALLEMDEYIEPHSMGRGIASGDINKDGFIDILLASRGGIQLFVNNNGQTFDRMNLDLPTISNLNTFVVALVDINNDGWLDIFLTSYITGNYYVLSEQGSFHAKNIIKAPSPKILTESLAFGDIDRDGDLDGVLGNWLKGIGRPNASEHTLNSLLINQDGTFSAKPLEGIATGDTLSLLLTDFTGDNTLDLIVGNDFRPPDLYYRGDGKGGFTEITNKDGIIPVSTNTTMSIDTADYDNDLDLDIYVAQVAAAATGPSVHIKHRPWENYCDDLTKKEDREACDFVIYHRKLLEFSYTKFRSKNINTCKTFSFRSQIDDCATLHVYLAAIFKDKSKICELIPKRNEDILFHCISRFTSVDAEKKKQYELAIPIIMNENVMLEANENGTFKNVARTLGIETTGWSWNAKFADFDNDGWQDIYIVNGFWAGERGAHTKFFFQNLKGKSFKERTNDFGLQNYMMIPAFTEIDIDNDGDLDILATSVNGPIWFYRNNNQHNNAIEFEFNDAAGNYFGIGNKIIIRYGNGQTQKQLREIKAGGGFLSFNAPVIHFGLGKYETIDKIEIFWSTGEHTEISGSFPVNAKYLISRAPIEKHD